MFEKTGLFLLLVLINTVKSLSFPDFIRNSNHKDGKTFAVLVAGSTGIENIRHQLDVCRVYGQLRKYGVKEENIQVLMNGVEDVRRFGSGSNGIPCDIPKSKNASLSNLIEAMNFTKSIHGSKNRFIFYFSGYAGPSLMLLPQEILTKDVMNKTISTLYRQRVFKKLVFYVEAPYATSIFDGILPNTGNFMLITASQATSTSYATDCRVYDGLPTCLGDKFTVNWIKGSANKNQTTRMEYFEEMSTFDVNTWIKKKQIQIAQKQNKTALICELNWQLDYISLITSFAIEDITAIHNAFVVDQKRDNRKMAGYLGMKKRIKCESEIIIAFSKSCYDVTKMPFLVQHIQPLLNLCTVGVSTSSIINVMSETCKEAPVQELIPLCK
ncbi:unnamed protein product [Bursaphelenchus xylophilus]|uniref:(pine wood nematode) hypothetical protein n=1 Tax=Bursaphelenchus xylophilus TaxID=6326 RepID=A0A1I7SLF5_BURXY|nr:unnamed protein product [Bursaphelenchus xylophilus]CAG9129555.1 unnamed protein product [Bursaphelenchus xylophilus]